MCSVTDLQHHSGIIHKSALTDALPADTVPFSLKTGGSLASFSSVVSLGCSSLANVSLAFFTFTSRGASSASKYPFLWAKGAWTCDSKITQHVTTKFKLKFYPDCSMTDTIMQVITVGASTFTLNIVTDASVFLHAHAMTLEYKPRYVPLRAYII